MFFIINGTYGDAMVIEEIMNDIPYLIKFQNKDCEYAKALFAEGQLFMQSAEAYINQEIRTGIKGQGDIREALVFDSIRIGLEYPIYCMYGVYRHQIEDATMLINKSAAYDFCPNGGFMTISESMQFINQFKSCCPCSYNVGMVMYGQKSADLDKTLLQTMTPAHHYKDSCLNYQQEFRIVLGQKLNRLDIPYNDTPNIPQELIDMGIHSQRFETYTLKIGDISSFSAQYSTNILEEYDSTHFQLSFKK